VVRRGASPGSRHRTTSCAGVPTAPRCGCGRTTGCRYGWSVSSWPRGGGPHCWRSLRRAIRGCCTSKSCRLPPIRAPTRFSPRSNSRTVFVVRGMR